MILKPKIIPSLLLAFVFAFAANYLAADILTHPENMEHPDRNQIKSILIGKQRFWNNGSEVIIALLKDHPLAEIGLKDYCGMTAIKFKNHWQRIAFSGRGKMPKTFRNLEDLISYVNERPGAIAVIPSPQAVAELGK